MKEQLFVHRWPLGAPTAEGLGMLKGAESLLQLGCGAGGSARAAPEAVAADTPYDRAAPVSERAGGISGHVLSTHA